MPRHELPPPKELWRELAKPDPGTTPATPQFRHNWLYSVLPVGAQLYLSGYCRACDQAFSKIIPRNLTQDLDILVTKMDIPKWGCVDPSVP